MDRQVILAQLISDRFGGSQIEFAKAIGKSPSQVNQWLSGVRNFGGASARHVEITLGLGQGFFDGRPNPPFSAASPPEPARPPMISEIVTRLGDFAAVMISPTARRRRTADSLILAPAARRFFFARHFNLAIDFCF